MEDGVLFGPAPYSAPAAYYFPLITRMTQVRVIKGPGAIALRPADGRRRDRPHHAPDPDAHDGRASTSRAASTATTRCTRTSARATSSSASSSRACTSQNTGFKELPNGADTGFDAQRLDGEGRVHARSRRARRSIASRLKLSYSDEISNETYLGLTDADFRDDPYRRYAASALDRMKNHRTGIVLDAHDRRCRSRRTSIKTERLPPRLHAHAGARSIASAAQASSTVLANADDPAYAGYYAVLDGSRRQRLARRDALHRTERSHLRVPGHPERALDRRTRTGPARAPRRDGRPLPLRRDRAPITPRPASSCGRRARARRASPSSRPRSNVDEHPRARAPRDRRDDVGAASRVTPGARVELIASRSRGLPHEQGRRTRSSPR